MFNNFIPMKAKSNTWNVSRRPQKKGEMLWTWTANEHGFFYKCQHKTKSSSILIACTIQKETGKT